MTNITISAADLQILLDIAEGYTSENGFDFVGRYAMPAEVKRAIANAMTAIRRAQAVSVC